MAKIGTKVNETKEAAKAATAPVEAKVMETVKKDEDVKVVAKTVAKKTGEVKDAAKTAAKTVAKKTVAKAAAKTNSVKSQVIVQYQCNEIELSTLEERVKAQYVSEGHKASAIKKLNIYVKPEEYAAYYVINDKFSGRVNLF